jgi:hypothetical protein
MTCACNDDVLIEPGWIKARFVILVGGLFCRFWLVHFRAQANVSQEGFEELEV